MKSLQRTCEISALRSIRGGFLIHRYAHLPDRIRILSLWDGEMPVAASFLTAHNRTLELPWSASIPSSRKKYSQVLMYWEFIQKAIGEGFQKIDLGSLFAWERHIRFQAPLESGRTPAALVLLAG